MPSHGESSMARRHKSQVPHFNPKKELCHRYDTSMRQYNCNVDGCDKQFKTKAHLKEHQAFKHHINVIWHSCGVDGCDRKCKTKGDLKKHQAYKHNINVTWHQCRVYGCDKRFKSNGHLKKHQAFKHDINVTWHNCDVNGCDKRFKTYKNLKRHRALKHDIDVTWHHCHLCSYKGRYKYLFEKHLFVLHGIGSFHQCGIDGCKYISRKVKTMLSHKQEKHPNYESSTKCGHDSEVTDSYPEFTYSENDGSMIEWEWTSEHDQMIDYLMDEINFS